MFDIFLLKWNIRFSSCPPSLKK